MYLTNEQVQELQDTGIDEKIEKFAELFPKGTEVTYELCVEHPDVFSFGNPGARLMPHRRAWKVYLDKVRKAKWYYKWMMMIPRRQREWAMQDPEKMKGGFERMVQDLANSFSKVPNFNREKFIDAAPRLFTFGPGPPQKPKQQALDEYKIEEAHSRESAIWNLR